MRETRTIELMLEYGCSESREEGEISGEDDENDFLHLRGRIKRRRDSESSEESRYSQQGRHGKGGNHDWHRPDQFRDEQFDNRYGGRGQRYDEVDFGSPRAHATASAYRDRGRERARATDRNDSEVVPRRLASLTDVANNTSRMGTSKMFKVEPFPKGIKPTDQFQEWLFWHANFEMAMEKAGTIDQRAKAIDLSLHIGEEIRRIIVAKGMLPRETAVTGNYQFYDSLTEQLDAHFRGLTDESVDVASFNALKQKEDETALEFELRLRQMATRVRETNVAMIRTRYIEGIRDKALRDRAFVDGRSGENGNTQGGDCLETTERVRTMERVQPCTGGDRCRRTTSRHAKRRAPLGLEQ